MSYEFEWYTEDNTALLTIDGHYTLSDVRNIDKIMLDKLSNSTGHLYVIMDVREMHRPHNFQDIRAEQKFIDHRKLSAIYIVADSRILKLAMTVIFSMSHVPLYFCDSEKEAFSNIKWRISRFA